MRYKNGLQIEVGDLAVTDNCRAVLITSVGEKGFYGLSENGDNLCFYPEREVKYFSLCKRYWLKDVFNELNSISFKNRFDSLPYRTRNMALSLTIGRTIQNNHKNQGVILGFINDGKEVTLICEHDKRINISDESIEYYIEGESLYEYLCIQCQKINTGDIQEG